MMRDVISPLPNREPFGWLVKSHRKAALEVGDLCGRIQRPGWVVNVGAVGLFMRILHVVLHVYFGTTPRPVTVTTRIITFLIGNPYKPSFVTVTGWGVDLTYTWGTRNRTGSFTLHVFKTVVCAAM